MNNIPSPCISIIIPVYNAEHTLARCLDSIFRQSFTRFEVIAINDGSTDNTICILEEYAHKHQSAMHIFDRANQGAAAARNYGISKASGDYITFIDDDDWIDKNYLEVLYHNAAESKADIVLSGYRRPDQTGRIVKECAISPNDEWRYYAVEAAWAKLYRRQFVRCSALTFLESNISEDLAFTLPAIHAASKITVLDYCGYNWFINANSVSNTIQRSSAGLDFERAMDEIKARLSARTDVTNNQLICYVFIRHVVWFLVWTSSGDDTATIRSNCKRYTSWLDCNFPNWRENGIGTPAHPTGDSFETRCIVSLFILNPKLAVMFILLYKAIKRATIHTN